MAHRKDAITSPTAAIRIVQAGDIAPPAHIPLTDDERIHFDAIVKEKPKADWSLHELDLAAFLARALHDFLVQSDLLRSEGFIVEGANGTKVNPRKAAVSLYSDMIISYRRTLNIHGRGLHGEARDAARRNRIGRDCETDLDDGLLAKPH